MSKHPSSSSVRQVADRPGEGEPVAFTRKQVVSVTGITGHAVSADMSTARVPDRHYVADIASVIRAGDSVKMLFGQKKVGGDDLRSLVVIHLPGIAITRFLKSVPEITANLSKFATQSNMSDTGLENLQSEPQQTVALPANMILVSVSGYEACLDYYYYSPFVMVQVSKGGKFVVDPVARVMLSASLLLAILRELQSLGDNLPRDLEEETQT